MKFNHFTLVTKNFDKLIDFYQKLPGCSVKPPNGGYSEITIGEESIIGLFDIQELARSAGFLLDGYHKGSALIQILVDDLDEMHALLYESHITILAGPRDMPWGSRSLYIVDPDTNLIEFYKW